MRWRELGAEHGAEWAGALDEWLAPENRVFEGGFLVGGTLKEPRADLSAPGWRLVRDLELPPKATTNEALAVLSNPQLVPLRGLYGLTWVMARLKLPIPLFLLGSQPRRERDATSAPHTRYSPTDG